MIQIHICINSLTPNDEFHLENLTNSHPELTKIMAYTYSDAEKLVKLPTIGTKQCVALVREYAGAPPTALWRQGTAVKGNVLLAKGTAIATFVDGKYQNNTSGNHAAFYVKQDALGIWVVDQWLGSQTIRLRRLSFKGKRKDGSYLDPSNNGDAFAVIE